MDSPAIKGGPSCALPPIGGEAGESLWAEACPYRSLHPWEPGRCAGRSTGGSPASDAPTGPRAALLTGRRGCVPTRGRSNPLPPNRCRVLPRTERPALDWLSRMAAPGSGSRHVNTEDASRWFPDACLFPLAQRPRGWKSAGQARGSSCHGHPLRRADGSHCSISCRRPSGFTPGLSGFRIFHASFVPSDGEGSLFP